jgi:hypothetical protein
MPCGGVMWYRWICCMTMQSLTNHAVLSLDYNWGTSPHVVNW